jgi:hypothetical protein
LPEVREKEKRRKKKKKKKPDLKIYFLVFSNKKKHQISIFSLKCVAINILG